MLWCTRVVAAVLIHVLVLITTPVHSSVCYCISSIYPMGTLLLGGRGCLSPARGSLSRWVVVASGPVPFYGPF